MWWVKFHAATVPIPYSISSLFTIPFASWQDLLRIASGCPLGLISSWLALGALMVFQVAHISRQTTVEGRYSHTRCSKQSSTLCTVMERNTMFIHTQKESCMGKKWISVKSSFLSLRQTDCEGKMEEGCQAMRDGVRGESYCLLENYGPRRLSQL